MLLGEIYFPWAALGLSGLPGTYLIAAGVAAHAMRHTLRTALSALAIDACCTSMPCLLCPGRAHAPHPSHLCVPVAGRAFDLSLRGCRASLFDVADNRKVGGVGAQAARYAEPFRGPRHPHTPPLPSPTPQASSTTSHQRTPTHAQPRLCHIQPRRSRAKPATACHASAPHPHPRGTMFPAAAIPAPTAAVPALQPPPTACTARSSRLALTRRATARAHPPTRATGSPGSATLHTHTQHPSQPIASRTPTAHLPATDHHHLLHLHCLQVKLVTDPDEAAPPRASLPPASVPVAWLIPLPRLPTACLLGLPAALLCSACFALPPCLRCLPVLLMPACCCACLAPLRVRCNSFTLSDTASDTALLTVVITT